MSRLEEDELDVCPKCDQSPHDTVHLFNCISDPTDLEVISLWTRPREAAVFLKLDPERHPPDDWGGLINK